jgi:hypothetical protein
VLIQILHARQSRVAASGRPHGAFPYSHAVKWNDGITMVETEVVVNGEVV